MLNIGFSEISGMPEPMPPLFDTTILTGKL